MNRRSFLSLGLRCAVLGAALSTGLSVTRLKQINEYSVLHQYTDKTVDLYGDGPPAPIKEQAFERMRLIAECKQASIVGYKPVYVPAGRTDKSDPMGQRGYFGLVFDLEEAPHAPA